MYDFFEINSRTLTSCFHLFLGSVLANHPDIHKLFSNRFAFVSLSSFSSSRLQSTSSSIHLIFATVISLQHYSVYDLDVLQVQLFPLFHMAVAVSAIGFEGYEKRLEISFFEPGVFVDPDGKGLRSLSKFQLDEVLGLAS